MFRFAGVVIKESVPDVWLTVFEAVLDETSITCG